MEGGSSFSYECVPSYQGPSPAAIDSRLLVIDETDSKLLGRTLSCCVPEVIPSIPILCTRYKHNPSSKSKRSLRTKESHHQQQVVKQSVLT